MTPALRRLVAGMCISRPQWDSMCGTFSRALLCGHTGPNCIVLLDTVVLVPGLRSKPSSAQKNSATLGWVAAHPVACLQCQGVERVRILKAVPRAATLGEDCPAGDASEQLRLRPRFRCKLHVDGGCSTFGNHELDEGDAVASVVVGPRKNCMDSQVVRTGDLTEVHYHSHKNRKSFLRRQN